MSTIRITLSGRKFSSIEGRSAPPSRGEYVAYAGKFFPVTSKTGYPLSVVADIAAGAHDKVVIIPGDVTLAFLSGSGRLVSSDSSLDSMSAADLEAFHKSLLRLTLLSDHKEVVVVGEVASLGNIPFQQVSLSGLPLPPVIKPARTWMMAGAFASICVASLIVESKISSAEAARVADATSSVAAAEKELDAVMGDVKALRAKLAPTQASAASAATAATGTEVLPSPSTSFVSTLREAKLPATNNVRVNDGRFQY